MLDLHRILTACFSAIVALLFVGDCSSFAADGWSSSVKLPAGEQSIELFNGKDLTAWDGHPDHWFVENGEIVGQNKKGIVVPSSTHLFTKKHYRNFRLLLEIKQTLDDQHSHMHSGVAACGRRFLDTGDNRWGHKGLLVLTCNQWGLYDAYGRRRIHPTGNAPLRPPSSVKEGRWIKLEILVVGEHIRCVANGAVFADFKDKPDKLISGPIGLQLHSNKKPQRYRFRGIRLVENPADQLASVKDTPKPKQGEARAKQTAPTASTASIHGD